MDSVATEDRCAGRWQVAIRASVLCLVASLLIAGSCASAWAKGKSKGDDGPNCDTSAKSDDDDDDDTSGGVTFKAGSACVGISGSIDAIGQAATVSEPRLGSVSNSNSSVTLKPDVRIE